MKCWLCSLNFGWNREKYAEMTQKTRGGMRKKAGWNSPPLDKKKRIMPKKTVNNAQKKIQPNTNLWSSMQRGSGLEKKEGAGVPASEQLRDGAAFGSARERWPKAGGGGVVSGSVKMRGEENRFGGMRRSWQSTKPVILPISCFYFYICSPNLAKGEHHLGR